MACRRTLNNMDLPAGVCRTGAGHLQYTSPKAKRGKYVHRVVIEQRIEETPYSVRLLLPYPYEVHHMDYNKEHNCSGNLLLLSNEVHSALTAHRRRDGYGKFRPKWLPAPDWALISNDDNGVPF